MSNAAGGRRRTATYLLSFAVVAALSVVGIQAAFSKPAAPAAPTLTSKPAAATSSTSATLTFTGPTGATFQCSLDGASYAACVSPKAYSGLAEGKHTFNVRDTVGTLTSAATSYSWTVDRVAPPMPTLTTKTAALSTTTSPSFAFTDAEAGVTFLCSLDTAALLPCTSPKAYSGLGQGTHTFRVRAVDAAANASPATQYSWVIDSVAPAAPTLVLKPTNPTGSATNTFGWTGSEAGLTYQCSLENGAWFTCATPYVWKLATNNEGQHQFAVRARDLAGNVSGATTYVFKYLKNSSGMPFTISGAVTGLTLGEWRAIPLRVANPNSVPILVSALTVQVSADSTPAGCPSNVNVELQQSNVSATNKLTVPANGSVTLPSGAVSAPRMRLKNLPTVNQDACKGVTYTLSYTGTATN